ncbi:MAG: hypothetical protein QXI22_08060 [Sulfolobales archaeon]
MVLGDKPALITLDNRDNAPSHPEDDPSVDGSTTQSSSTTPYKSTEISPLLCR